MNARDLLDVLRDMRSVSGDSYGEAKSATGAIGSDPPKRTLPEYFTAAVRATQEAIDRKRKEAQAC